MTPRGNTNTNTSTSTSTSTDANGPPTENADHRGPTGATGATGATGVPGALAWALGTNPQPGDQVANVNVNVNDDVIIGITVPAAPTLIATSMHPGPAV